MNKSMLASFKVRGMYVKSVVTCVFNFVTAVNWVIFCLSTLQPALQVMMTPVHLRVVKRFVWALRRQRSRVRVLQTTLECARPLIGDSVEVSLSLHSLYHHVLLSLCSCCFSGIIQQSPGWNLWIL